MEGVLSVLMDEQQQVGWRAIQRNYDKLEQLKLSHTTACCAFLWEGKVADRYNQKPTKKHNDTLKEGIKQMQQMPYKDSINEFLQWMQLLLLQHLSGENEHLRDDVTLGDMILGDMQIPQHLALLPLSIFETVRTTAVAVLK
eukprot:TRINITY_DN29868_c0_g1_i1.p2 TRINITY_DN29868_c0_g1~~TRINITY_DN29868_c0_g1_i1.p2  ORF type:complete len:142 (+),score=16.88 TRINITY_DN29868_c0_g1_i1:336-761(+)